MDQSKTIFERIRSFNAALIPENVQLKYRFMSEGPYRFFRGTDHLFYEDLYHAPPLPSSPDVWMCGDLHVENLGSFKGDNRLVYFDLNDFDEAVLGPSCWELVRMVTSIFVVFDHLLIEEKKALKWANLFLDTYARTLVSGKALYIEPRIAGGIVKKFLDAASKRKQKDLLAKHTIRKKGRLLFRIDNEKHFKLDKDLRNELLEHMSHFISIDENSPYNFNALDVCFRVAGTGSLGVKRYLFLLQSNRNRKDYLLLDMKEATPSSLIPYISTQQPGWASEAERVVTIQKRVQNIPPALLSISTFKNISYVIQEMQPVEDKVDLNLIKNSYREVCTVMDDMAKLTAYAHLRSSGRQGSATADELIRFGEEKEWKKPLIDYAIQYAQKVKTDYESFIKDLKNTQNKIL